jgi:hypothetical protein
MLQMNFWIDIPMLILMTSRTMMRWILLLGERLEPRWLGEMDAKVMVVGGVRAAARSRMPEFL